MPQPQTHLFVVTLTVSNWVDGVLDLKMPVWTPGSYLVREYAKQLQDLVAQTGDGKILTATKVARERQTYV